MRRINEDEDMQLRVREGAKEDEFDEVVRESGREEMGWNDCKAVEE